ncbi:large-conductance mechanosensitive channel [Hyaloraphidium curvatum]|nr:large-conductance mechanosensitive channel [Hyaloraphidium curvatum]
MAPVDAEEHLANAEQLMDSAQSTAEAAKAMMEEAKETVAEAMAEAEVAAQLAEEEDEPAIAAAVASLADKIGDVKEDIESAVQDVKKIISDFVPDEIEENVLYVARGMEWLFSDFVAFINRGNVLDLAVGVIIGAGFTSIVNATVDDFLSPVLASLTADGPALINKLHVIRPGSSGNTTYDSYELAKSDGAVAIYWGHWCQTILNFLFIAPVLYMIVRLFAVTQDQKARLDAEAKAKADKEMAPCPYCLEKVPKKAVKCRACASVLQGPVPYEEAQAAPSGAKKVSDKKTGGAAGVKAR